jgi:VWFA-related protein
VSPLPALLTLLLTQAPPVFRADVEAVYVDVYVTRKGAPVTGLGDADFVLKDNGVSQRAWVVDREEAPVTAVLVLDNSSSLAGARLEHLKGAARTFVRGLHPRDEAALVSFRAGIEMLHAATTDRARLIAAIDRMTAEGTTALIDALFVCLKRRFGNGRPVLVLFSDGDDTASWSETDDLLRAARETSTVVYMVRALQAWDPRGESSRSYLLRRVVESTGGSSWTIGSGQELEGAFREVLETVNARYVLAYEPSGVKRPGRHRIELSVKRRGVEVQARKEYFIAELPPTSRRR